MEGKAMEAPVLQHSKIYWEAKQTPRSSGSPLHKSSWAENYGGFFSLYQYHDDKKYHVNQGVQNQKKPSPTISILRIKGSFLISASAAPVRNFPQGCAPVLASVPDTAGLFLSGGGQLLSIPRVCCYLGELSWANKLQFKDACCLICKEVAHAI